MRPAIDLAVAAKGRFEPGSFLGMLELARAAGVENVRVFVAHDQAWPDPQSTPAAVTLCKLPVDSSLPQLWAEAIAQGTAPYVAILDIGCPPAAQWWSSLARELDRKSPAFFGPVDPGWQPTDPRMVGYLAEYAQFGRPLPTWLAEVPGNNVVLRRELLPRPDVIRRDGFSKTHLVWQLGRELGLQVAPVPELVVTYGKGYAHRRYWRRRYRHGRCFAGTRHLHPGQPARWLGLCSTPALPALRLARIVRACWRRADLRRALLLHLGPVIASEVAWSLGEFAGYAFGPGNACERLE